MSSRPCGAKTAIRLGLACVALAAIGFIGLRQVEPRETDRLISIGKHLGMARDIFMQAFSERALADAALFKGEFEFVFKEVDSEDPSERSKMSMKATMKPEGETKRDRPTLIATFKAKPGQQEDLKEQFDKVLNAIESWSCETMGQCQQINTTVNVTTGSKSEPFGEGEFVFIEIPEVDTSTFSEDMKDSFKEQRPTIVAEVNVGCTMDDLFESGEKNVLEALNGVHVKGNAKVAQSLFKLQWDQAFKWGTWGHHLRDFWARAASPVFPAFASMKTRNDIIYKADEFKDLPKVAKIMDMMNQTLQQAKEGDGPETEILIQLLEVWQFCDGVAGSQIVGLPSGMEHLLEFKNFRPTKFLAAFGNPEARGSARSEAMPSTIVFIALLLAIWSKE